MSDLLLARSIVAGMSHELYDLQARGIGASPLPSDQVALALDRGDDGAAMWRDLIAQGVPRDWLLAHLTRAHNVLGTAAERPVDARARALIESEAVAAPIPPLREGTLVYQGAEPWRAPTQDEVDKALRVHAALRADGRPGLPQIGPHGTVIGAEPEPVPDFEDDPAGPEAPDDAAPAAEVPHVADLLRDISRKLDALNTLPERIAAAIRGD